MVNIKKENDEECGKCKSFSNHEINQCCLASEAKLRFEIIYEVVAFITHVFRRTCDSPVFVNINLVVIDLKFDKCKDIKHFSNETNCTKTISIVIMRLKIISQ